MNCHMIIDKLVMVSKTVNLHCSICVCLCCHMLYMIPVDLGKSTLDMKCAAQGVEVKVIIDNTIFPPRL